VRSDCITNLVAGTGVIVAVIRVTSIPGGRETVLTKGAHTPTGICG
jgi:hypothetical protein